jgi:hypothetical protein
LAFSLRFARILFPRIATVVVAVVAVDNDDDDSDDGSGDDDVLRQRNAYKLPTLQ